MKAKKLKTKKVEITKAEIVSVIINCPKLDKQVTISADKCSFSGHESSCEMCGSHGSVEVNFMCECGKRHEIGLDSW